MRNRPVSLPNLTWSPYRQLNERIFALLNRDRAQRDDESYRSVLHQEYWDAGTNQPGKAFTSLQEQTPYLDTLAASAIVGLPHNYPATHSFRGIGCEQIKKKRNRETSHRIFPKHFKVDRSSNRPVFPEKNVSQSRNPRGTIIDTNYLNMQMIEWRRRTPSQSSFFSNNSFSGERNPLTRGKRKIVGLLVSYRASPLKTQILSYKNEFRPVFIVDFYVFRFKYSL